MSEYRYTKEHEWAKIDGDMAICGITDHAQKALGDIVYVELPVLGKKVKQSDQTAVVESSKAASEIYAPLDGEVVAINTTLTSDPAKVNSAATTEGWFFKLKLTNAAQANTLMNEAAYQDYLKGV